MSGTFSVPAFTMGSIIVAYMVPYGVAALLSGPLSRVVNVKKVTLCCLFIFSLASFFSGIADSFKLLLFSRVMAGIAASAIIPLSLALIGCLMPYEKRGKAVGLFFSVTFASSVSGVFLSGLVDWRWMFFIPAFAGIINTLLVLFLFPSLESEQKGFMPSERKPHHLERDKKSSEFGWGLTSPPKFLTGFMMNYFNLLFKDEGRSIFAYILLVAFIYSGIYSWLGIFFIHKFGMNQWWISLSLTCIGLGAMVGELVGGIFADRNGRTTTAACGVFLLFVTTVSLVYVTSFLFLGLLLFLHGLAWTINHSALATILTDFPSCNRTEATSLNSALRFISGGIGTAVVGFWIAKGFNFTFLVGAFLFLLLALVTRGMLGSSLNRALVTQQDII